MKANLLRAEVAASGMTLQELAEKAKITRSAFSAKINGHRSFDVDEIIRICDVLKIEDNQRKAEIFLG